MNERTIAGLVGTLAVVTLGVVGLSTFLRSFVVDVAPGAQVTSTLGVLATVAVVVVVLSVWGAKTDRWRQNPYW